MPFIYVITQASEVKVTQLCPHGLPMDYSPWTVACQAPLSMGFFRQEYWSGLPFPSVIIQVKAYQILSPIIQETIVVSGELCARVCVCVLCIFTRKKELRKPMLLKTWSLLHKHDLEILKSHSKPAEWHILELGPSKCIHKFCRWVLHMIKFKNLWPKAMCLYSFIT